MTGQPSPPRPIEVVAELSAWDVLLTSGDHIWIAATSYSHSQDAYRFHILMKGQPHFEMEVARIPSVLVVWVQSHSGYPDLEAAVASGDIPEH